METLHGDTVFLFYLANQFDGLLEKETGIDGEYRQTRCDFAHCDVDHDQPFRAKRGRNGDARTKIVRGPLQNVARRLPSNSAARLMNLFRCELHVRPLPFNHIDLDGLNLDAKAFQPFDGFFNLGALSH